MTYSNEIFHSCLGAFKQPPKGRNKHVNWLTFRGKGCSRMLNQSVYKSIHIYTLGCVEDIKRMLIFILQCACLQLSTTILCSQRTAPGEFHLISPLVTTTEHQRPPSSLNTPSKLTLHQGQTFHKHRYSLLWDRQRNQNTCWPSTSDLYSCTLHVLLPATEGRGLTWVEDFQRLSCLEK